MPIKNRVWCIEDVLKAIEDLEYPKERIKLIFVDDYSTDGTFEAIAKWQSKWERAYYRILLIQERTNITQAKNIS